ncbi:unnamed protein product [Scytosiphon promiscuus]
MMTAVAAPTGAEAERSRRQRPFVRAACFLAAAAAVLAFSSPVAAAVPPDHHKISSLESSFITRSDDDILSDDDFVLTTKDLRQRLQRQEKEPEQRLALVVPVSSVGPALSRMAGWSDACPDGVAHSVDLVLFLDADDADTDVSNLEEAHFFGPDSSSSELLDARTCFGGFKAVVGDTIFQIFTDKFMRRQFDEYDAIAVVDWESVEVQEGAFDRLHRVAFSQEQESAHPWWIMASDARPLAVSEARERRRRVEENRLLGESGGSSRQDLVWNIDGRAIIYNNRSYELRRFFAYNVSPSLYSLPFDLALWATFSFMPTDGWQGIFERIVSVDYLVVSSDPDQVASASDQPIFLDITTDEAHEDALLAANKVSDNNFAADAKSAAEERLAHAGAGSGGDLPQQRARPDAGAVRKDQQKRDGDQRSRVEDESELAAGLRGKSAYPAPRLVGSQDPFTDDVLRGNLCVFVPGYLHQRSFAEVTVESVLRFMPGVRVAVAADPSEMDDYQLSVGSLPGVVVTRSIDVKYSAVTADLRCGEDTELVLYLEPGVVLSRPFTEWDTHDPLTGELLVIYTEAASAGPRHETFARSAGEILAASNLPAFTAGTDLILPVSANQDLRKALVLWESAAADWRIHFHAIDHNCFESDMHVPQILASMAFMLRRPGVAFVSRTPHSRASDGTGTRFDFVDSFETDTKPLALKPRFACRFYTEVYYTGDRRVPLVLGKDDLLFFDDGEQIAVQALRAALRRFDVREEACASGLVRLPWPALVSPDGFGVFDGGEGNGPIPDKVFVSDRSCCCCYCCCCCCFWNFGR